MSRIDEYLKSQEAEFQRVWHAPAFCAQRRSKYMRQPGRRVVKSVLYGSHGSCVLALVSASRRIDIDRLRAVIRAEHLPLASLEVMNHLFKECDYATVPGFGRPYSIAVALDEALFAEPCIFVPGDRTNIDYRLAPAEFVRLERPIIGSFSRTLAFSDVAAVGTTNDSITPSASAHPWSA